MDFMKQDGKAAAMVWILFDYFWKAYQLIKLSQDKISYESPQVET